MSWSGKKYKRVSSENVERLIEAAKISKENAALLKANDAIFSYTRGDGDNISFTLESSGRDLSGSFKLGEEHEMERRDGSKVKVVHRLESENVLTQVITDAKGHKSFFKREFDGNKCILTITASGNDIEAKICYVAVE